MPVLRRVAGLDLPASRLLWSDHDVVLGQRFRAFQASFVRLHLLFAQANPIRVFARQSLQSWMLTAPLHPQSLLQDHLQAIQQRAAPLLFQDRPTPARRGSIGLYLLWYGG